MEQPVIPTTNRAPATLTNPIRFDRRTGVPIEEETITNPPPNASYANQTGQPTYASPLFIPDVQLEKRLGAPTGMSMVPREMSGGIRADEVAKLAALEKALNPSVMGAPYTPPPANQPYATPPQRKPVVSQLPFYGKTGYRGAGDTNAQIEGLLKNPRIEGLWDDITANEDLMRGLANAHSKKTVSDAISGINFAPLMASMDAIQGTDLAKYSGPQKTQRSELAKEALSNLDNLQKNKIGLLNSLANMTKTKETEQGYKSSASAGQAEQTQALRSNLAMSKQHTKLIGETVAKLEEAEGVMRDVATMSYPALKRAAIWLQKLAGDTGALSNLDVQSQMLVNPQLLETGAQAADLFLMSGNITPQTANLMMDTVKRLAQARAGTALRKHDAFVKTAPANLYMSSMDPSTISDTLLADVGTTRAYLIELAEKGYRGNAPVLSPVDAERARGQRFLTPDTMESQLENYATRVNANPEIPIAKRQEMIKKREMELRDAYRLQQKYFEKQGE